MIFMFNFPSTRFFPIRMQTNHNFSIPYKVSHWQSGDSVRGQSHAYHMSDAGSFPCTTLSHHWVQSQRSPAPQYLISWSSTGPCAWKVPVGGALALLSTTWALQTPPLNIWFPGWEPPIWFILFFCCLCLSSRVPTSPTVNDDNASHTVCRRDCLFLSLWSIAC